MKIYKIFLSAILSIVTALTLVSSFNVSVSAEEAPKGIASGRYSQNQVFDCYRTPPIPKANEDFRIYNFDLPFNAIKSTSDSMRVMFDESEVNNKIFYFKYTDDISAPFALFMADDVNGKNEVAVSLKGNIYGLSKEGFLYVSADDGGGNDLGYFISNLNAYAYGDELTYKPDIAGPITKEQAQNYTHANSIPQGLGNPDITAIQSAKKAVVNGSVDVASNATQADKTAAVQKYVSGILSKVSAASGVVASVNYNATSGMYEVTLSKGNAKDSLTLTMTVNVAKPNTSVVGPPNTNDTTSVVLLAFISILSGVAFINMIRKRRLEV